MNEALKVELEAMYEADQSLRTEAMALAKEHGMESSQYDEMRTRGRAQDAMHTSRLLQIVEAHGWPGTKLVGELAGKGAFFVLQHADIETQKHLLPALRTATAAGDVAGKFLPLLEDRVRVADGRDQLYGTQVTRGPDGKPALWPIEHAESVDERRAAAGLEPLEEYLQRFGLAHPDL